MKILALDTSSKNCSVAIVEVDDNKFDIIAFENSDDEKTHSQKLMPMIDEMFKKVHLSLADIDLQACCLGPGSFTGIRIGIATAKAFADSRNIKTCGVTSLESLAYNISDDGLICSILDCKNNNVYSALFSKNGNSYFQIGDNIAESITTVIDKLIAHLKNNTISYPEITFVGDGCILHKDLITEKFNKNNLAQKITFSTNNIQSAVSLARCAYNKYLDGKFGDSNYISPLYLRQSQAERNLKNN